jgi:hypothetical protein
LTPCAAGTSASGRLACTNPIAFSGRNFITFVRAIEISFTLRQVYTSPGLV